MSNKIKCEWCGHYYDTDKYENCPKCGGVNYQEEIQNNEHKEVQIDNKNKSSKSVTKVILLILFVIVGIVLLPFIVIFVTVFFQTLLGNKDSSFINNDYYYEDSLNDYETVKYEFYTDDSFIEFNGAKMYLQYVYFEDYWKSSGTIYPKVNIFVSDTDYSSHVIDMYLVSGDDKYRISTDNNSFTNSSVVSNLNDILKAKGHSSIYGKASLESSEEFNAGMFDSFLIVIDDNEFKIPLRYSKYYPSNSDSFEKDYSLSEKISFGNGNSLYIDKVNISGSKYLDYNSVYLTIETVISDYSNENMEIFLEDKDGRSYKLYEDSYFSFRSDISNLNSVLKNSLNSETLTFNIYSNEKEFSNLKIYIDGTEYIIKLK